MQLVFDQFGNSAWVFFLNSLVAGFFPDFGVAIAMNDKNEWNNSCCPCAVVSILNSAVEWRGTTCFLVFLYSSWLLHSVPVLSPL